MQPEQRELSDHEEFNGWMGADHTVEVRSRVKGHIKKIHFSNGQYVKAGDLLYELDPRPFQAEIGKAGDDLKVYEAQKVAADKEEARMRILQTKGGASVQQVEKAEADALALAAQISAAKNVITYAKLDLEYSRITADIDGRVGKSELSEGNLVNAGGSDPLLTTLVSVDPIRIYFNIDERSMQRYAKSIGAAGGNLSDLLAQPEGPQVKVLVRLRWRNRLFTRRRIAIRRQSRRRQHRNHSALRPRAECKRHVCSRFAGARAAHDWSTVRGLTCPRYCDSG